MVVHCLASLGLSGRSVGMSIELKELLVEFRRIWFNLENTALSSRALRKLRNSFSFCLSPDNMHSSMEESISSSKLC